MTSFQNIVVLSDLLRKNVNIPVQCVNLYLPFSFLLYLIVFPIALRNNNNRGRAFLCAYALQNYEYYHCCTKLNKKQSQNEP